MNDSRMTLPLGMVYFSARLVKRSAGSARLSCSTKRKAGQSLAARAPADRWGREAVVC